MLNGINPSDIRDRSSYIKVDDRINGNPQRIKTNPDVLGNPESFAKSLLQFAVAHGSAKTLSKQIDEDRWRDHMKHVSSRLSCYNNIPPENLINGLAGKFHMRTLLRTMLQKIQSDPTKNELVEMGSNDRLMMYKSLDGYFDGPHCQFVTKKNKPVGDADAVMAIGEKPEGMFLFESTTDPTKLSQIMEKNRLERIRSFMDHGKENGIRTEMFYVVYQHSLQTTVRTDADSYIIYLPLISSVEELSKATQRSLKEGTYESFQQALVGKAEKSVK